MNRRNTLPFLAVTATLAAAGSSASALDALPLAYSTSFEAPTYRLGALVGQDGWTVAPGETSKVAAMVIAKQASSGAQSVRLNPSILGGGDTEWIRPIKDEAAPAGPIVDVGWDMYLERGKHASMAWQFTLYSIPSRAICTVYVAGDDSDAVCYRTLGLDPVVTGVHLKRDAWNKFHIHLDLATGTVAYSVNGEPLKGPDGASPGDAIKAIAEIGIRVMGPGDDAALIDSISMISQAKVCAANCDHSSTPPVLTVNDFLCFVNEYAKASSEKDPVASYANFDHSVKAPVLNVNDFVAFMNAFAAGCD